MYWTMLRREVFGRRRQTIVVAAGLAIAIALVITVSSLSTGISRAQTEALQGIYGVGTDITVTGTPSQQGGRGGPRFDFGNGEGQSTGDGTTQLAQSRLMAEPMRGTIESSAVQTIAALDGVAAATGTLSLTNTTFTGEMPDFSQGSQGSGQQGQEQNQNGGQPPQGGQGMPGGQGGSSFGIESFSVLGVDPSVTSVGPLSATSVTAGRALAASDAGQLVALVDSTYASSAGLSVGDSLEVGSDSVTIVGIVSSTTDQADTAANVFLPIDTARTLAESDDVVSTVYVSATSAGAIDTVQSEIEKALPEATVSSQADLASEISGSLSSAASLISNLGKWLSIIVLLVAFIIAVLLTSSGVSRRRREFGTLKAIGWSNKRVVGQIAGESLVQALIGGLVGLVLGLGIISVINVVSPTLQTGGMSGNNAGGPNGMPGGMPTGASGGGMGGFSGGGFGGMGRTVRAASDIVLHAPVTIWIVVAAVGLSIVGGLIAGSFAAWRASRLSPAEALRTIA